MRHLTFIFIVLALGTGVVHAQSATGPTPRLVVRSGLVEVQRGIEWVPAPIGSTLSAGSHVRTGSGSTAAIEIEPGKVVTLPELSQVQIGEPGSTPAVQLESGSMKVFAASDIQVAAKDTTLDTAERPLDLEVEFQGDQLNLRIFNGAVRNGSIVIRGGNRDPGVRTYSAGRSQSYYQEDNVLPVAPAYVAPTYYVYPFFAFGRPDPNAGRIVEPVVRNPTNPGYRPTQIVPPMSDPIRVPVTRP